MIMKKEKGFTLAEMLIVVAIIGVLIAILVPSFTTQLEKARETKNAANIRSTLDWCMSEALTTNQNVAKAVYLTQEKEGWDYVNEIAGYPTISSSGSNPSNYSKVATCIPKANKSAKDSYVCIYVCVYATGEIKFCKGRPAATMDRKYGDFVLYTKQIHNRYSKHKKAEMLFYYSPIKKENECSPLTTFSYCDISFCWYTSFDRLHE